MKPEFLEDFVSSHPDPLDARTEDFPWEELFARMDGPTPEETLRARLSGGLAELLRWLVRGPRDDRLDLHDALAGRRAIALAWVVRPDIFGGISLRELANRLDVPVSTLSHSTAEISSRLGVHNRAQARYNLTN